MLNVDESFKTMFTNANISGQIREYSISRSVKYSDSTKNDYTRQANAIGGYLKYETATLNGLSFDVAAYTTNGLFLSSPKTDYTKVDPTLLGKDNNNYTILGESYLQYNYGKTLFKLGRQKLNTPMAGADDVRMLPNLYEAYLLTNLDIKNTALIAGHITKFAQGTYGRAKNGGISAATVGYSYIDSKNQVGDFVNLGTYAIGKSTDGLSVVAVKYDGIKNFKMQLWDYYAYDILNTIYAQVDYSSKILLSEDVTYFIAAQYIQENSVGKEYIAHIDSKFFALKADVRFKKFSVSIAYSTTTKNEATDSALKHAIVSLWGGMPAFTRGMVSRQMFLAGTRATKAEASYNSKYFGANLKTTLYYVSVDIDKNNGLTYGDSYESGFDAKYNLDFVENLQICLRANFPHNYNVSEQGETQSWNEYRLIINYDF